MTRRKNSKQKEYQKVIISATHLIKVGINKMSELEFSITIIKSLPGLEKSIRDARESLSAAIIPNWAEIKKKL